jgi:BMFP domain-containing protein YqiC
MIAPDAATRATLHHLMGCSAPWYREPRLPVPADEVGFYQDETERLLLASTRRDVFVVSIVYAMAKRRLMSSAAVKALLSKYEQRKLVCLDCVQRDSFAVWREMETALKLRITSSALSTASEKANRAKNEWMRSLPAAELEIVRPQTMSPNSHCRSAWQQRKSEGSAPSSTTSATPAGSSSPVLDTNNAVTPFEVNIHAKCESYERHQILFSTYRTLMEAANDAKAALEASDEAKDFAEFVRDRDGLFRQFGLEDADQDFKAAERRESDRSRVDGGQHEYETASSGARRMAEILWENFNHNIASNHFHAAAASTSSELATTYAPKCTRSLYHLSREELQEFFIGSLCCTWSSAHERLAAANADKASPSSTAVALTTFVGDDSDDSLQSSLTTSPAAAISTSVSAPKRVKPKLRVLDFSQNLERKMFHRRCRAAGVPHLVMITSAKYRCGTVCGELDVTIMDVIHNELLLVVEAKASAGDLIKARDQKARLASVVDQLQRQMCPVLHGEDAQAPSAASDFSCAGTLLEWKWDAQRNVLVARDSGANTQTKQQQQQAAAAIKSSGGKRFRQTPTSVSPDTTVSSSSFGPITGPSIVRIKPDAIVGLPLHSLPAADNGHSTNDRHQRGSIVWFAYCTSCSSGSGSNKTPYYSSIAHMVLRALSNEIASALLLTTGKCDSHVPPVSDDENSVVLYKALVKDRLGTPEQIQDLVASLNVRKVSETVRRLWLSEMAKPTSSFLRPPDVLWQELELMEFRDVILV